MAADYNKPVTTDNYADILTQLRDNIAAAQNMLDDLTGVTNIPTGALRYDQTAKKFQTYNGTTFVDTVLSKEAGGTGTATPFESTRTDFTPDVTVDGTSVSSYLTRRCYDFDLTSKVSGVQYELAFVANDTGFVYVPTGKPHKDLDLPKLVGVMDVEGSNLNIFAVHQNSGFSIYDSATGLPVTVTNGDNVNLNFSGVFVTA